MKPNEVCRNDNCFCANGFHRSSDGHCDDDGRLSAGTIALIVTTIFIFLFSIGALYTKCRKYSSNDHRAEPLQGDTEPAPVHGDRTDLRNSDLSAVMPPQYNSLYPEGYVYQTPDADLNANQLSTTL